MKPLVSTFLIFLFSISLVSAITFEADRTLSEDYSVSTSVDSQGDQLVFLIDAEPYSILNFELIGQGAYEPILSLYDVEEEKYLIQEAPITSDQTISLRYTMSTKPIYAIINNAGSSGSYTFTYNAKTQDDARLGIDAPKRYRDAELISVGTFNGHLGEEDTTDYYAIDLSYDETIIITIKAKEEGRLDLNLVDASGFNKLDIGKMLLEEEKISNSYTSLKEQTAFIGIKGMVPYELVIQSDQATPPMPPTTPELPEITQPEPTETEEEAEEEVVIEEKEGLSIPPIAYLVLLIILISLVSIFLIRKKPAKKGKKKKAKKKK